MSERIHASYWLETGGLQIVLKGGQIGLPWFFGAVRQGRADH